MKRSKFNILMAAILVGVLMTGCSANVSSQLTEDNSDNTTAASVNETSLSDITSDESETAAVSDEETETDSQATDTSSKSGSKASKSSTSASSSNSSKSNAVSNSKVSSSVTANTTASSGSNSASESSSASKSSTSKAESSSSSAATSSSKSSAVSSTSASSKQSSYSAVVTEVSMVSGGKLDTSDMFSTRDLTQNADLTDAKTIEVTDGKTIEITEEGVYVFSGSAKNCTIKVNADKEAKVQLVLDSVEITNDSSPAIYVVSADKCFVTTTESSNSLSVTGKFTSDGDTKTDAVIFSKDGLVLNGLGSLTISSSDNGISCKDDLKVTGGTYTITSSSDAIEANDSIRIGGGTITIKSGKDGLHCENDDDDTVGWIYIADGTLNITSSSDGIQGTTYTQIDGGTINISSTEGLESTYVQLNGGTINMSTTDDGINASQKSRLIGTPTFEMTGGSLTITMSGSDVDCIDSNGNIIVSGGKIDVTYPAQGASEAFDSDGTATYTGGTIIINGTQVDSIPQSTMGGMGGMNGGFGGGMNGGFGGRVR